MKTTAVNCTEDIHLATDPCIIDLKSTEVTAVMKPTFCNALSVIYKLITAVATAGVTSDKVRTQLITVVQFTLVNVWRKTNLQHLSE